MLPPEGNTTQTHEAQTGRDERARSLDGLQLLGRRFDGVATAFSRAALDGGKAPPPPEDLGVLGGSVMRHFRWTMNYPLGKLWARYQRDDLQRDASGQPADLRAEDLLGQTPLVVAIYNEDLQAIGELLAAGANVNRQNRDHFTPLRFAAEGGSPAVIKALLAAGADPNARGASPETPLMVAVATGHQEVAGLLLQAGRRSQRRARRRSDGTDGCGRLWLSRSGPDVASGGRQSQAAQ